MTLYMVPLKQRLRYTPLIVGFEFIDPDPYDSDSMASENESGAEFVGNNM